MTLPLCFRLGCILLLLGLGAVSVHAQQTYTLGLLETISLAKQRSPDAVVAKTNFRGSYWQYRYYRAAYLPSLRADAELPNFSRALTRITLPDGSDAFVLRNIMSSYGSLTLDQRIGPTGGSVFVASDLQRLDVLNQNTTSYLSNPVRFGFTQPLFAFNELRWQRQIEPLFYQEAQKEYVQNIENLSEKASNLFFDVLIARNNYNAVVQNGLNTDTLYRIAKGRYSLGKIAENELLQLELNLLNAGLAVEQAKVELVAAEGRLKSFLGFNAEDSVRIEMPAVPDSSLVDVEKVWQLAREYNPQIIAFERMALEAQREVARARGQTGLQANLTGQYGLNRSAGELQDVYTDPLDQQFLVFGIQIPILNWGRDKGAREMAKAQQQLVQTNIKTQQTDFEQQVKLEASAYNLQKKQLVIAAKAYEVADRRYFIARERYLIGKISITDLNLAQMEKDAARTAYYRVLKQSWASHYRLRSITLHDLKKNEPLTMTPMDVLGK